VTDLLDGIAIAAGTLLGHDDAVMRLVLGANAGKADFECHVMGLVA
jgi:hypothetical protein